MDPFEVNDVRSGSKADMAIMRRDVRFTPESRHRSAHLTCPLCAKSGNTLITTAAP